MEAFVSSLGTDQHTSKPAIVGILLEALDDQVSSSENQHILQMLAAILENVPATGPDAELIDSQLLERISNLPDTTAGTKLREAMSKLTLSQ